MEILAVIDMQKDFVDGALGTKEAEAIVPAVLDLVNSFSGDVIFTRDTHFENYPETQEGKLLPVPHCIKGTPGWDLIPELNEWAEKHECPVFDKPAFGNIELAGYLSGLYNEGKLEKVTLIGLCTDICVISNALVIKAFMPELPVSCIEKACAGVTPEKHAAAIETMKSCQILVE